MTDQPVTVQGWYPDPDSDGSERLRWWENNAWTPWVSEDQIASRQPLPDVYPVPALATLPTRAALWGLVGAVAAIAVAGVGTIFFESVIASLIAGTIGLYGATTVTVWLVSRRYGSGNLVRDLGLRFQWADLGGGIAAAIAGRAIGLAGLIAILAIREQSDDSPSPGQFDAFDTSDAAIILALTLAVLVAPLFEEIFFRGFLQATLETRLGPAWAIAIASTLFGSAHLSFDANTTANLVLFFGTGLAGVAFGFAYWSTRRLGTAIVAHTVFNLVAAVVVLILRFT